MLRDGDDRQAVGGHARGLGEVERDALDRGDEMIRHGLVVGAKREFELHLVGDDVAAGAAVDGADGDDRRSAGLELSADDRLEHRRDFSGEHDRVARGVRPRTVAAVAAHEDIHGVDVGVGGSLDAVELAGRQIRESMQGDHVVGAREAREESVHEHGARAAHGFLRVLADEHRRAGPAVLQRRHHARRADETGDVRVVRAGVHDRVFAPGDILADHGARVGQAGFLLDRERIHVGADEHRRAGAVFHHAHDAEAADLLGDFAADGAQFLGDDPGGAHLGERELRVQVEVLVDLEQRRVFSVDLGGDELREIDGAGERGKGQGNEGENEAAEFHLVWSVVSGWVENYFFASKSSVAADSAASGG